MLESLHIENIAVIERADISFREGLNVLTGETGAGKSIVIDSIGAILGDRVSREIVRTGAPYGLVTAVFRGSIADSWLEANDIPSDEELIISRKISPDSKSSCRVNGLPVTAAQLRDLGNLLIDVHGQNDGRQLMDEANHIVFLDRFASLESDLSAYSEEYGKYRALKKEIERFSMDEAEKERLADSLRFRIQELESARIEPGEEDTLLARRSLLKNSEKLTESVNSSLLALSEADESAISLAENASYFARKAADIAPELEEASKALEDAGFLLSDASERMRDFLSALDFSPEEYNEIESRLSLLNRLERKYRTDEQGLADLLEESRKKLSDIEYSDETLALLNRDLEKQTNRCLEKAEELSNRRKSAVRSLRERVVNELRDLSMPSVRFEAEFTGVENETGFSENGKDTVRFLMSANAGMEPGRISRIASGGELSRIMLALKNVFAEKDPVPTMIFDEIDSGVSGIAAQRVGEKLYNVSRNRQVMCVTHLPQIAAFADCHFLIRKEERSGRTYTAVEELERDGRISELSRLYSGDNITLTTLASASEQLDAAYEYKNKKTGEQ